MTKKILEFGGQPKNDNERERELHLENEGDHRNTPESRFGKSLNFFKEISGHGKSPVKRIPGWESPDENKELK